MGFREEARCQGIGDTAAVKRPTRALPAVVHPAGDLVQQLVEGNDPVHRHISQSVLVRTSPSARRWPLVGRRWSMFC